LAANFRHNYPGKLLHDFHRAAVRTLGVPRSTAMAMVGCTARLDAWADEQQVKAARTQLVTRRLSCEGRLKSLRNDQRRRLRCF
jgi:hypothetical protein